MSEEQNVENKQGNSFFPCVSQSIWLIERIWFDVLENEIDSAVGYSPFGYIETEDKAKDFCQKGEIYTQKNCWAVRWEMPEYRYKEVKYCG